jgi:hypothetical protein
MEAIASGIAGPNGAIKTDMVDLNLATQPPSDGRHPGRVCLAKVEVAERAALASLQAEARTCIDQALQETPYQPLLLVRAARLRLLGDASDRAMAMNHLRLAVALSPGASEARLLLSRLTDLRDH